MLKNHSGHWPFTRHRSRIIVNHITIENSLYRFWADFLGLTYMHLWLRGRGQRGGRVFIKSIIIQQHNKSYSLKGSDSLGHHIARLWLSWTTIKHCQRHNGPEDWVHLNKVTSWVHITNSNTNLDQISSSESRPSINFKISASRLREGIQKKSIF